MNLSSSTSAERELYNRIRHELKMMVSKLLKLPLERLETNEYLMSYGFDSILLTSFTTQLNDRYRLALTPALFFTYPTLEKVSLYLGQEYADKLLDYYGMKEPRQAVKKQAVKPKSAPKIDTPLGEYQESAIAIIGMAGRMPRARTWRNFGNIYNKKRV